MSGVASGHLPKIRYRCPSCSEAHEGLPALGYQLPDAVYALSDAELEARADVSSELCTLDGKRFFVRATLAVPIHDLARTFDFGPWVEMSGGDFARYAVHENAGHVQAGYVQAGHAQAGGGGIRTLAGTLANDLALYPRSLGLPCAVAYGLSPDERPSITIIDGDHPLGRAQRTGISVARVRELVSTMKGFVMLVA